MSEKKNKPLEIGSAESILAFDDSKTEVIDVPEWGCAVKVKSLSKKDEFGLRMAATERGQLNEQRFEVLLFVFGVVEPKFEPHQADVLVEKSSGAFNRVTQAILRVSGMTTASEKDVEETFQE